MIKMFWLLLVLYVFHSGLKRRLRSSATVTLAIPTLSDHSDQNLNPLLDLKDDRCFYTYV